MWSSSGDTWKLPVHWTGHSVCLDWDETENRSATDEPKTSGPACSKASETAWSRSPRDKNAFQDPLKHVREQHLRRIQQTHTQKKYTTWPNAILTNVFFNTWAVKWMRDLYKKKILNLHHRKQSIKKLTQKIDSKYDPFIFGSPSIGFKYNLKHSVVSVISDMFYKYELLFTLGSFYIGQFGIFDIFT